MTDNIKNFIELLKEISAVDRMNFMKNIITMTLKYSDDFSSEDLNDLKNHIDKFSEKINKVEKTVFNEKLIKRHKMNYADENKKRKLHIIWS